MKRVKIKSLSLIISLLMIIGVMAGGTLAFLRANTDDIANTFTPSEVTTAVNNDYSIKNEAGEKATTAWIRATYTVTWQDVQGNVYGKAPVKNVDYEINLNLSEDGWVLGSDGFYYWTEPVAPGESTGVLLTVTRKEEAPDGYALCVEVLGSGIQKGPAEAVEAWSKGVAEMNGDTLVVTPKGGN